MRDDPKTTTLPLATVLHVPPPAAIGRKRSTTPSSGTSRNRTRDNGTGAPEHGSGTGPMSRISALDPERLVARWAVEYRAAMEGIARRLTGDPHVAEDLAQEATIKALEVASSDPRRVLNLRRPCGWMCGIVRHVTLRWLEKETRRVRLLDENAFFLRELMLRAGLPELERGAAGGAGTRGGRGSADAEAAGRGDPDVRRQIGRGDIGGAGNG